MSQEQQRQLFKLFAALEKDQEVLSTTGIGLGLTICRRICEKLGGDIEIQSNLNEGTSVTFSLKFRSQFCGRENGEGGKNIIFSASNGLKIRRA